MERIEAQNVATKWAGRANRAGEFGDVAHSSQAEEDAAWALAQQARQFLPADAVAAVLAPPPDAEQQHGVLVAAVTADAVFLLTATTTSEGGAARPGVRVAATRSIPRARR